MKQVEMHFLMSGSYWVTLNEEAMDAYGTLDPEEMARLDQGLLEEDPSMFTHEVSGWSVTPGKVVDKEDD